MSYAQDDVPQRGWFGRNWLWFVPLMLLFLAVVICGGCIAAVAVFGERIAGAAIGMMPEFQQSMSVIQGNAEVREALGEPIEMDGLPTKMDQGINGQTITREIGFNVKGPKGTASVALDSETVGAAVTIKRLELTLSDGKTLDLTPAGPVTTETTEGETTEGESASGDAPADTESGSTETESEATATP